jgi:adenine-specific DNA-methyltransferase
VFEWWTHLNSYDPRGPWISNPIISNKSRSERPTLWYSIEHPRTGEEIWPDEERVWRFNPDEYKRLVEEDRLYWGDGYTYEKPRIKRFLSEVKEGVVPRTWWTYKEAGSNDEGQRELIKLFGAKVFSAPKPTRLIRRLIHICTGPSDLVLDFFAGSGATGQAVIEHNVDEGSSRRYMMIKLPEPIQDGEYKTISDITAERMRRVGEALGGFGSQLGDTGFRSFRLTPSNFAVWDAGVDSEDGISDQLKLAVEHVAKGSDVRSILTELLLKAGFPLTASVQSVDFSGVEGYSVADGALLVCLSRELTIEAFESMVALEPAMILVLDAGFGGDDELKVNALQTVRARNQQRGSDIALRVV